MKIFELQTNLTSYAYPIIKIITSLTELFPSKSVPVLKIDDLPPT